MGEGSLYHYNSGTSWLNGDTSGYGGSSIYGVDRNALVGLVDQGIRDSELTDLETISLKQDELYKLIDSKGG